MPSARWKSSTAGREGERGCGGEGLSGESPSPRPHLKDFETKHGTKRVQTACPVFLLHLVPCHAQRFSGRAPFVLRLARGRDFLEKVPPLDPSSKTLKQNTGQGAVRGVCPVFFVLPAAAGRREVYWIALGVRGLCPQAPGRSPPLAASPPHAPCLPPKQIPCDVS